MPANRFVRVSLSAALLLCSSSLLSQALAKPFMIVGLDEKTVKMVMGENAIRFFSTYLPSK